QEAQLFLVESRFPRLAAVLITGATMSIAGLIMQQLSQNKFAAPSTSGTIEASTLGILLSLILFPQAPVLVKILFAFACALVGASLFLTMLQRVVYKDPLFIPLMGIMLGRVIDAVTTFIAYKFDLLQSIMAWTNGGFSGVLKGRYELLYLGLVVIVVTYIYAHKLTIAGFGESFSHSLGLNYKRIRQLGIALVAMGTSIVVLTVGEMPFIGIIVPNLVTLWQGDNVRRNLPFVAVGGAIFVLACDIFGRLVLAPFEVPASLTMGIIGSLVFLYFLVRRRRNG
ncbi:MAG: iron chelate uptake ABC transporter family permease subunit, partial [Veillonella sp.]|nr:iron chelate uptake ABC transporter family permease subunit [Veillonella sp.]